VLDGGEGGGVSAVDPTLLEVPKRRHDQVVPPRRSKSVLKNISVLSFFFFRFLEFEFNALSVSGIKVT
jgi:hypothetical protein